MKIILKNINLLNPDQGLNEKGTDLLITDGKIAGIGQIPEEKSGDAKVYDFSGKYAVPGLFDMHVHLREPGREDEETVKTGCDAAAAGGGQRGRWRDVRRARGQAERERGAGAPHSRLSL